MIEGNLLIRASAGTGKTFALATRYIRLMLLDGVAPERIVALTFSRMAAQEIYTKILERLWAAASGEVERERRNLLDGLDARQLAEVEARHIVWDRQLFVGLLRRAVGAQATGAIATIDSFILRIVRNFPLELGFQNAVEVLDRAGEREAVDGAIRELLARTEDTDGFIGAFRATQDGKMPRRTSDALAQMMHKEGWRHFVLEHPESGGWTVDSMAAALGIGEVRRFADLSEMSLAPFLTGLGKSHADQALMKFAEALVKTVPGERPDFGGRSIASEFMRAVARHPCEPYVEHLKSGGEIERYEYSQEVFAASRADLMARVNAHLRRELGVVAAKLRLFAEIERIYDARMRRVGKLTFADFTNYSAAREDSEAGIALQNLEFRFDTRFDHWALDEFQDTSEVQWKCLERLVESAASAGGGRTVVAVGDLKQSIYTWRGGNDTPFKAMMGWPAFGGEMGRIADLAVSHRYRKHICDFVNAVFGPENLRSPGLLPAERARAIWRWLAEDCWKTHEPELRADGSPRDDDYVKVVGVPDDPATGLKGVDALLPVLAAEVRTVWDAHERVKSTESVGVLVRKNEEGLAVAECLRKAALPVVWEGLNAVADVPAVGAVVNLLRLADHPEDTLAWQTVSRLLPVRELVMPEAATPAEVSARVAADLSHGGLARTLRSYCSRLCEDSAELDALSCERLRALVRTGVEYERLSPRDYGVDGFERFLAASGNRESSSSHRVIRILTIHRSKGLTFDRVFVPLCESAKSQIVKPNDRAAICGRDREWVLPHLPADIVAMNAEISAVVAEQSDDRLLEALRTYYVALTRARKAMYVVQPMAADGQVHFRSLVESAVRGFAAVEGSGARVLFESGTVPEFAVEREAASESAPWVHSGVRERVERVSPSGTAHAAGHSPDASSASVLFDADYGLAAKRGIDAHAAYQDIEWLDETAAAGLPAAFREAFVRPSPDATVWRERAYEILDGTRWESGRFDRVVFVGTGDNRSATIYDFKTNTKRPGETDGDFTGRMERTHSAQMAAYRRALSRLTGIPPERIRTRLLLEALREEARG